MDLLITGEPWAILLPFDLDSFRPLQGWITWAMGFPKKYPPLLCKVSPWAKLSCSPLPEQGFPLESQVAFSSNLSSALAGAASPIS